MLSSEQISTMSEHTDIPTDIIMQSLGIWRAQAMEPVTTIEQAEKLYCRLPRGSAEETNLLLEWLNLCTTPSQVQAVLFRAPDKSFVQSEVMRKWRKLSSDEIKRATSREQAMAAHANAPHNSPERARAMRKWIYLCYRPDELFEAYKATVRGSKEELMVVKRLCAYYTHV